MGSHLAERIQVMQLSTSQWHQRYLQQAGWTASVRDYFFKKIGLNSAMTVLEVGCGTGAVLPSIPNPTRTFGLDIQFQPLLHAKESSVESTFLCADGLHLPFPSDSLDITFCHYLLLWLKSPVDALAEMKRVTKIGGHVIAFAEPDHECRVDHPSHLVELGRLQSKSLVKQGVNITEGRELAEQFSRAGLDVLESGVMGYQKPPAGVPEGFDLEWRMIEYDLKELVSSEQIIQVREMDRQAWINGNRVLWVPTFYAIGRVISNP